VAVASAGPYVPYSRQITTPIPHHSIFYRPDALSDAQPTVSVKVLKTNTIAWTSKLIQNALKTALCDNNRHLIGLFCRFGPTL